MNKGLEALQDLYSIIKEPNVLTLKAYDNVAKELKVLEIIKEKRVDIGWLIRSKNCSKYNLGVGSSQALKKEEYDLLKEVLK